MAVVEFVNYSDQLILFGHFEVNLKGFELLRGGLKGLITKKNRISKF